MQPDTLRIVASNLTIAYCSIIIPKYGPGTSIQTTAEAQLDKGKLLGIYKSFVTMLETQTGT